VVQVLQGDTASETGSAGTRAVAAGRQPQSPQRPTAFTAGFQQRQTPPPTEGAEAQQEQRQQQPWGMCTALPAYSPRYHKRQPSGQQQHRQQQRQLPPAEGAATAQHEQQQQPADQPGFEPSGTIPTPHS
jgi:hypothetical protein